MTEHGSDARQPAGASGEGSAYLESITAKQERQLAHLRDVWPPVVLLALGDGEIIGGGSIEHDAPKGAHRLLIVQRSDFAPTITPMYAFSCLECNAWVASLVGLFAGEMVLSSAFRHSECTAAQPPEGSIRIQASNASTLVLTCIPCGHVEVHFDGKAVLRRGWGQMDKP